MNLPMSISMALAASLLSGGIRVPGIFINILIGFVIAALVSILLPIQMIGAWFAGLFHLKAQSLAGALVSNIIVALIFNVIIGFILSYVNVGIFAHQAMGAVIGSFIGTFIPLYLILYVVAFIMQPIALKAAAKAAQG